MSLMITLDDAIKVLSRGGFLDEEWDDDDGRDYIRSELEQKCYCIIKRKSASWIDLLRNEIEEVSDPKVIAEHIADGTLHNWLECHRDIAMAQLEMLASREKDQQ